MPELLSDITKEETERKVRAARFEYLTRQRISLEARIKRGAELALDPEPLRKILALCDQVEKTLVVRRSSLAVHGGANTRDMLVHVAGDALAQCEIKQQAFGEAVARDQAALAQIKAALKQEFGE